MKEICTLIWSEWRRQRKIFLFLLASTIAFYMLMLLLTYFKFFVSGIELVASALAIGFPLLYAVGLCDSFSAEFTNKSNSFLMGLPLSKTKIYFTKYLSSFTLFLAVSIIGSLLMYSLTNVILNSQAFLTVMDLNTRTFSLTSISLLSFWILVHAAVFLYNLINRNSNNGIIMLLILPVLLVILAPAAFVVNMFLYVTDAYWFVASVFSSILTLYLIILMLGWYLWNTRISQDLRTLKPVLSTLGMMLATSVLLYCLAYVYVNYQYNSALLEAKEKNLLIEEPSIFHPTELPNASMVFSKYIKGHDVSRMQLYKNLASQPYLSSARKALQKKQNTGKEYLNNQDVKNIYSILEKVSDKYKAQNFRDFYLARFNTRLAIIFLIDLAKAQARIEKTKDFFSTLRLAASYCVLLSKMEKSDVSPVSAMLLRDIYRLITRLNQEAPAFAIEYQKALDFIKNNKIYCPSYDFLSNLRYINSLLNPRSSPVNNFNTIYYRLRAKQGLASWIRYEIKRDKLYLEAEKMINLKEIIKKNKKLIKEAKDIFGFCGIFVYGNGLENYFLSRSRMAGDKICLALKIFCCRYGRFPDKLQELCPEILKEIPLVPISQKRFKYKRAKNGFILNAGKLKRMYDNNKSFGFYDIYTMNYNLRRGE